MKLLLHNIFVLLGISLLISCGSNSGKVEIKDTSEMHHATVDEIESLVEQFILADSGSLINILAGFYELETQLIIDNKNDIKIKGAGKDKSILSCQIMDFLWEK